MKVYDVAQVSVAAPHRFHVTQAGRCGKEGWCGAAIGDRRDALWMVYAASHPTGKTTGKTEDG